jgi:hypothetical protein
MPSPPTITSASPASSATAPLEISQDNKITLDMSSRYLGLVVVPGQYITKIEVEEFASQIKDKDGGSRYARGLEEWSVV